MKRASFLILSIAVLILSGCFPSQAPTAVQPAEPTQTPILITQAPTYIIVTATPESIEPTALPVNTEAPTAEVTTPAPTAVPGGDSITITQVVDLGGGKAAVFWDSVGSFPSGFKVIWSDVDVNPTFPLDSSVYASDPASRSAMFSGEYGKIYYVRVCRFTNNACDLYSNLGIFAFFKSAPTAFPTSTSLVLPTKTPGGGGGGGGTPTTPYIKITGIKDAGTGKAYITWEASGTFAYGFKIVYSKTHSTPTFGTDPYFVIKEGTIRDAYIDGDTGYTYYYRICRYTGTTCDIYSNAASFTFPGIKSTPTTGPTPTTDPAVITITGITNTTLGNAKITWAATGSFPNGFKILYSKTNSKPTLGDKYVYVPDGTARSASFSGDPGSTYYVRMCKYYDSRCVVYSAVETFTFTPGKGEIALSGIADVTSGQAKVTWTTSGTFDYGYAVMYSEKNSLPTLGDSVVFTTKGVLNANITGIAGHKYYIRVCGLNSIKLCDVISPVKTFTFAQITLTGTQATGIGTGKVTWDAVGSFPKGFKLIYSLINKVPTYESDRSMPVTGGDTARSFNFTVLQPGLTYYLRICQAKETGCAVYSDARKFVSSGGFTLTVDTSANVNKHAELVWTQPSTKGVTAYQIYRITGVNDPYFGGSLIGTVTELSKLSFTDPDAFTSGQRYTYRVCLYNGITCFAYSNMANYTAP